MNTQAQAIAKTLAKVAAERDAFKFIVTAIHMQLDGEEWNADTCEAIAGILMDNGYNIRDPWEVSDDE
jgi:hypothetical protein